MTLVTLHAVVYAAANAALVLLWLALGGELAHLRDPIGAVRDHGFWPMWVIAFWGVLLAFHAGVTVVVTTGRRRRRRARWRTRGPGSDHRGGTRWITAMFTDIVDSTSLNSSLGDDAYSDLLATHRELVRRRVAEHDGVEVGTQGDGFLLRFDGAADALRCAIDLQRRAATGDDGVRIRIGLHAGEVVSRDGDVIGRMVNLAARVADRAGADEILVTEPVADHAPPDLDFEDRGLLELKGDPTPRHVLALRPDA
jgi:class 3 adenylate cyclase